MALENQKTSDNQTVKLDRQTLLREEKRLTYLKDLRRLREACLADLATFVQVMRPWYKMGEFHLVLCRELQRIATTPHARAIINAPPRHGKTEIISRLFPAWLFARNPSGRLVAASHTAPMAKDNNLDVQSVIMSPLYQELFPEVRLPLSVNRREGAKQQRNASVFNVVAPNPATGRVESTGGEYRCAGVGGPLTGQGATIGLIADDLVKNDEEASSPTKRAKLSSWWNKTFRTRLGGEGKGFVILLMTRWHEYDIAGELIEKSTSSEGEKYEVLTFPAVRDLPDYEERPYDKRQVGEPLCPHLGYDLEWAARTRLLGEDTWQGLYQQRPFTPGGGVIPVYRLKFWHRDGVTPRPVTMVGPGSKQVECGQEVIPEKFGRVLDSWDFTFKDTTSSDFVAGLKGGTQAPDCPAKLFILDFYNERADITKSIEGVDGMRTRDPPSREHLFEDKANGPAIETVVKGRVPGIIMVNPQGGKTARAHAAKVYVEAGDVYLPHPSVHPWSGVLVQQLASFPKGKHDDLVDAFTQLVLRVYGKREYKIY